MEAVDCTGCQRRDAELAQLREQVKEQGAELAALQVRLDSVLKQLPKRPPEPPSQATPADAPTTAASTVKRKPGGQPGHPPHLKQLLPPERVHKFVSLVPTTCRHCQKKLPAQGETDAPPRRHQVAELPPQLVEITEYQLYARTCRCCGKITQAELPVEARSSVGSRLAAFYAYLVGLLHVSKRGVEELSDEVLGLPIALGTVSNLEQEMSAALEPAYNEAMAEVQQAQVKHLDETGWKQAGAKRWLWVAATCQVVLFLIHRLRNARVLPILLGKKIIGVVTSDRLHAYDHLPLNQRQLCWAHVKRNFQKLVDLGGKVKQVGEALLKIEKAVFETWHLYRGGGCTRAELILRMVPCQTAMAEELARGRRSRNRRVASFCTRLGGLQTALWTFVNTPNVEPTNNHAERLQRLAVIWRKCCYGCHSADGCQFVSRLLTAIQTRRFQEQPVLPFLADTLQAHRAGQTPPPLLATA